MANKSAAQSGSMFSVVALALFIWFVFGNGSAQLGEKEFARILNKVAADTVEEYRMVERKGSPADLCVHASMVSAAYLQAKDEDNYQKWKDIEAVDCDKAGVAH